MSRSDEDLNAGLAPLPPGRHGFSRDFVAENQRERLLNGVVEAVVTHGYNETTIAAIVKAAGVSRRAFYEHFADKEECFAVAYRLILAHLCEDAERVAKSGHPWPDQVRLQLATLLETFAADPVVARFCMIEPLAAGGETAALHRDAMQRFAALLRPEPGDEPAHGSSARARERALVGGIATLIVNRLKAGGGEQLEQLLPDLHELVLTPYLGREEAKRIAREPSPTAPADLPPAASPQLPVEPSS